MIAKPSIAFNDFSGTAKDVTARSVNGRNVLSVRAQHSKIVTPAQAVSRNKLSKISRAYKQLSDSQITAWGTLASHLKGISTFGSPAELTPHNAFVRINSNRAMVGMPLLTEAPVYKSDVPEVLYEDLWISPDMIVFTGLEVPSDTYRLVVKMSPAQSPGTSSGWSKTVIVAPGIVDDWGEANITKLFTETIGVAPQAGMKYYLECWWLDTETGFTGESMWVSAICKEGSTAYNEAYVPRARFTQDDVTEESYGEGLDFELSPGSAICSVDAILYGEYNVACSTFFLAKEPKNFIEGKTMILARGTAENNYSPQTYCVDVLKWIGDYEISFKHRGGHYEKPSEVHTTGVFVDR
ncbi:MAG: hypothetical protein IKY16_09120 [Bacteroidales bacterium]|nr:hypothetical protein [Bacteroidales bacterium]